MRRFVPLLALVSLTTHTLASPASLEPHVFGRHICAGSPGAWLMPCHIGWHFAPPFVERRSELAGIIDDDALKASWDAWNAHLATPRVVQGNSGA